MTTWTSYRTISSKRQEAVTYLGRALSHETETTSIFSYACKTPHRPTGTIGSARLYFRGFLGWPYTLFMATSAKDRITKTLGVCGGRACIAGHRVRVLDVVEWHEHQGMTPDQIVSEVPSLTLADVHAALAYYFDHMEEIREEMRAERALVEEARRNNPSLVKAKLRQEKMESPS